MTPLHGVRQSGSGRMQKPKLVAKTTEEASLPELLNRLELALPEILDRASVDKALVDPTNRLSSVDGKRPTRTGRPAPALRRHQIVVESLSLFSRTQPDAMTADGLKALGSYATDPHSARPSNFPIAVVTGGIRRSHQDRLLRASCADGTSGAIGYLLSALANR
jgi:hypothetical protein